MGRAARRSPHAPELVVADIEHYLEAQQHKELLSSLQRGDQVVTSSGIVGEVVHIKDDQLTVRSGESKFVMLRSGISSITNRTAPPASVPAETKQA